MKKRKNQIKNFSALKFCGFLGTVFLFQVLFNFDPGFNASSSPWWKFFTSSFGHSGMEHLLNNLFFIGLFGSLYEGLTSSRIFYITFLVAAVVANLTAFIFFLTSSIIGASGGAFGIMAALAVYRPNNIGLALGVPVPMWAALIIYTVTQFAGLTAATNTAYEAHLFGMVAGGAIGLWLRENFSKKKEDELDRDDDWKTRIREWEEKYML
jgi:membrane associated rhomboid family serine protease